MSANKSNDPNKKHYFNHLSTEEVRSEGASYAEQNAQVVLWQEGQSEDETEAFKCIEFNPLAIMFTLEAVASGFLSKLTKSKLTGKSVYVKIGSGKIHTFSTSTLIYDDVKKNYTITLNTPIFKTLQRENYRLSAGLENKIQIKLGEGMVFDGLDISAGGMSFVIPIEDKGLYPKDMTFSSCTVRFNRERFTIDEVRIAGSWPIEKSTGDENVTDYKVGVAFSKLDPITEEQLFKHINSVARVQEMTKSLKNKKTT